MNFLSTFKMSFKSFWGKVFRSKNSYQPIESRDDPEEEVAKSAEELDHKKITSFNAFWNVSNSIQGVAILAMPFVIKGGGWWSVAVICFVAILSNYTGQILIQCHYDDRIDLVSGELVHVRVRFVSDFFDTQLH